ncbi:unnamed protein product [Schistosoma mattheei]|uniref:Uncharacterized protein n=1 Tax=Schistosoma mattheei TaxID=31246 RepID=A0A183NGQ5_9TREM|nr:unnamed protein product [Schistosoma mattheei]
MNRYAGHAQSGSSSHHPHQRYPSGPTGDVDFSIPVSQANGPLRPTNETKRGGHGDWSRGCAGWRQRSYSGSEQSDVFYYNHSNHRGRGNGHPSNEVDGNTGRGRGRGRGSGRQGLTHREPVGGQSQTSGSNACRPASCLVDTPGGQLVVSCHLFSRLFVIGLNGTARTPKDSIHSIDRSLDKMKYNFYRKLSDILKATVPSVANNFNSCVGRLSQTEKHLYETINIPGQITGKV